MISRTIDIVDINQYIIEQLSLIFDKSTTKTKSKTKSKTKEKMTPKKIWRLQKHQKMSPKGI